MWFIKNKNEEHEHALLVICLCRSHREAFRRIVRDDAPGMRPGSFLKKKREDRNLYLFNERIVDNAVYLLVHIAKCVLCLLTKNDNRI